jgi:hypothetical protein
MAVPLVRLSSFNKALNSPQVIVDETGRLSACVSPDCAAGACAGVGSWATPPEEALFHLLGSPPPSQDFASAGAYLDARSSQARGNSILPGLCRTLSYRTMKPP